MTIFRSTHFTLPSFSPKSNANSSATTCRIYERDSSPSLICARFTRPKLSRKNSYTCYDSYRDVSERKKNPALQDHLVTRDLQAHIFFLIQSCCVIVDDLVATIYGLTYHSKRTLIARLHRGHNGYTQSMNFRCWERTRGRSGGTIFIGVAHAACANWKGRRRMPVIYGAICNAKKSGRRFGVEFHFAPSCLSSAVLRSLFSLSFSLSHADPTALE